MYRILWKVGSTMDYFLITFLLGSSFRFTIKLSGKYRVPMHSLSLPMYSVVLNYQ